MNAYLPYLFEANVALLLFGAFYYLVLRKDTHFKLRRLYILSMTAFSLVLPLLHFNLDLYGSNNETVKSFQTMMLPEIVITAGTASHQSVLASESFQLIPLLYIVGTVLLGAWFLFQIGQVLWFFISSRTKIERRDDHILILTNGTLPTFSFFRLLFLDNSVPLSQQERECVIAHELTHIRQMHSMDILFLEIVKVLFWMNPICWYFRNQIQDLHEYLADEKIVSETSPDDYSHLLAKMALNKAHLSIGHHFNKSKTLKRIQMMKTTKTKLKQWKLAALVPVLGLILLVFSCNDEAMVEMQEVMETSSMTTNIPLEAQVKMDELQAKYPDAKFNYMETDMKNEEKVKEFKEMDPKTIAWLNVNKEDERMGMIVQVNGNFERMSEVTKDGDVFLVVENPAEPIGGYPVFYEYIAQNLKYPQQARTMGVEGKVFIQFVVDTDGSITEVQPVKGIGAGCDAEAARVISESPKWTPAKQRGQLVKQRIILPIVFSLGNSDSPELKTGQVESDDDKMDINLSTNDGLVAGRISKDNGDPLPGVNIVIENTNQGTVTNQNGEFKIQVTPGNSLVFSFIGFETRKIGID